ncbi:Hypothetical predicted protein [Cloeon dipterum]|uniref:Amino acid transporter transmembrane domain-containing protein n=1 Tax=Cloeon dipterum TaxID=197152 RepID=A0A8S1CRT6_9INSE|nr:Hypothetical predicted protein [Cloeon dipterum]
MPISAQTEQKYSTWTGLVYIFNLIVGTGALTLPSVFSRAGWAAGVGLILVLAFMSFLTVTFVVESIAAANALLKWKRIQERKSSDDHTNEHNDTTEDAEEDDPLVEQENLVNPTPLNFFCIEEKVELGQMAVLFFSRWGQILFYLCIIIYLYGDLAIYAAAISKSMTDVVCSLNIVNGTMNTTVPDSAPCWLDNPKYSRMDVYRAFLGLFLLLVGPFTFFNVQKTKYLQMFTSVMRWSAFSLMISIASAVLIKDGVQGHPPLATLSGLPALFGACVYSFMCHHSLPGLITPIKDKNRLYSSLLADYLLVVSFYLLLALTGVFAFNHLEDLYTLVFWQPGHATGYFLALFPVLTLSTSFPVVAVTLRSNMEALAPSCGPWWLRRGFFPLLAILPPLAVAFTTTDLSILVGVTGTYAGAGVQYVIPAILVWCARRQSKSALRLSSNECRFGSPFIGAGWVGLVLLWALAAVVLVTFNTIEKLEGKIN